MLLNRCRSSLSVSSTNVRNSDNLASAICHLSNDTAIDQADRCMICARSRLYRQPSSPRPGGDLHFSGLWCPLSNVNVYGEVDPTVVQLAQALFEGRQIQMALLARVERRPELVYSAVGDASAVLVHGGRRYERCIMAVDRGARGVAALEAGRGAIRKEWLRVNGGSWASTWGMRSQWSSLEGPPKSA